MVPFDIVVAMDLNSGIGKDGHLPWDIPGDLRHFKDITSRPHSVLKKNAVIMGRKTWEALPDKFRPLPGRVNLVLTHNKKFALPPGVLMADNLDMALMMLGSTKYRELVETVFVIGGAQIFQEAIKHPRCRKIYLTQIESQFECDTFFPPIPSHFEEISQSSRFVENSCEYYFAEYASNRRNTQIDLLKGNPWP